MIKLICPKCKAKLIFKNGQFVCSHCQSVFPVTSGIANFFVGTDKFYEGRFGAEKRNEKRNRIKRSFLWSCLRRIYLRFSIINLRLGYKKYYRELRTNKKEKIKVLDLGCGGGNPDLNLNKNFYVVGVDLSLSSLLNAKNIYNEVYKASITNLPFLSEIFDCVCSFDVIGHISLSQKDKVFKEIYRVLKPGGLSFHYIEVDALRGYNNWAKKYPELYKKYFIDADGHIGLEYYQDVLQRFKHYEFSILDYKLLAKFILPPGEISKRFNNEYKEKNFLIKTITFLDSILSKNRFIELIWGMFLKLLSVIIEPFLSNDYGNLLFVVLRKPKK